MLALSNGESPLKKILYSVKSSMSNKFSYEPIFIKLVDKALKTLYLRCTHLYYSTSS